MAVLSAATTATLHTVSPFLFSFGFPSFGRRERERERFANIFVPVERREEGGKRLGRGGCRVHRSKRTLEKSKRHGRGERDRLVKIREEKSSWKFDREESELWSRIFVIVIPVDLEWSFAERKGRKKGEEDRKGISCDYFLYRSRSRFLYRTDRYRLVRAPQFSGLGSDSFERWICAKWNWGIKICSIGAKRTACCGKRSCWSI